MREVTLASVVKKDFSKEMGFYQKPEQKEPRRENSQAIVSALIWDELECLKNRSMIDMAPVHRAAKSECKKKRKKKEWRSAQRLILQGLVGYD